MTTTGAKWFILLTQPQREITAVAGLIGRGVKAYGPTVYKRLIQRGKKVEVERPMFPGYVFVRLTKDVDDFHLPKRVAGVRDYLYVVDGVDKYGHPERRACVMPDGLLEAISSREQIELERFQRSKTGKHNFAIGENVRVAEGPFAYFAAEVCGLDEKGRVAALVNLFGRKTKVQFDGAQLERV